MSKEQLLRNWTILPVFGVTPDKAHVYDGYTSVYPRLLGDITTVRRISNPYESVNEGECGVSTQVEIQTSEIVEVRNRFDGVVVTTKGGSQYKLEGEPRPSFVTHLKAFNLESGPNAVAELVRVLHEKIDSLDSKKAG